MTIDLESQPRRSEQVLARRVKPEEGAVVLLHPRSGEYYSLDEVGGAVWGLCDGAHSVREMVAILEREYDAPPATIEADVLALLADLADERLVVGHA